MGNTSSTEALPQEEAPSNPAGESQPGTDFNTLLSKLRDIPRAAAITEGKTRTRGGGRPPNTFAVDAPDCDFIQVPKLMAFGTDYKNHPDHAVHQG